jgi:hypothetical protein
VCNDFALRLTTQFAFGGLDQACTDDKTLNLAGAFVKAKEADVAVNSLYCDLAHVSHATVDLNREICDFTHHLGAVELGHGWGNATIFSRLVREGSFAREGTSGHNTCLHIRDHGLNQLEITDCHPALCRACGIGNGLVESSLGRAHGKTRDMNATSS